MRANLDKIHEMSKLLSDNNRVRDDIMTTFGKFGLSQTLRRIGMEKLRHGAGKKAQRPRDL